MLLNFTIFIKKKSAFISVSNFKNFLKFPFKKLFLFYLTILSKGAVTGPPHKQTKAGNLSFDLTLFHAA